MEELRADLARLGKLGELKATYKTVINIPNNNSSKLWDRLNDQDITRRNNPMAWERTRIVSNWIGHGKKVLDVGFGSGILEKQLFKYNLENKVYGIDFSESSIERVKKIYPKGIYKKGRITKIPFNSGIFDIVVALEILEHVSPIQTFNALFELNRVLKKGGKVVISVPLNEGLKDLVRKGSNPNAHVRVYTPDLIKAEMILAGFQPIREARLFAFNTSYEIKSLIAKLIPWRFKPNNIIVMGKK